MTKYAAFDVSVNDSALCILDADGNIVEETKVASEADVVAESDSEAGGIIPSRSGRVAPRESAPASRPSRPR